MDIADLGAKRQNRKKLTVCILHVYAFKGFIHCVWLYSLMCIIVKMYVSGCVRVFDRQWSFFVMLLH